MDIKVREVSTEEKSSQQIEQELLDKHEEKQEVNVSDSVASDTPEPEVKVEEVKENVQEEEKEEIKEETESPPVDEQPPAAQELAEDEVLSYIGKRYGKKINSLEELVSEREEAEPLPEDVASYLKYKKETGRGFEDFAKLQKDYSDLSPDALLREYYTITEEGLDSEDIDDMMDEFNVSEETHEPADIKKIKLAKKKEIAKAKKFLREQQNLYKQPLESRESSAEVTQELQEYRQYLDKSKSVEQLNLQKQKWFTQKTEEVLNDKFKGFKFDVGDQELVYAPNNYSELKKNQSTPLNFVNKFIDEKGFLKDAENYHRGLSMAMNPDQFARFFYEQGKAQATEDVMKKTKNIDMNTRNSSEAKTVSQSGLRVKSVSQPSSKGLKIRSIKKV